MDGTLIQTIAVMRVAIGFLGEREHYAWWQCSFLAPSSRAFLAPVFGRTQLLAQCSGVTRAAALVHDERIGVGQVYHLFRLPEDVEQAIHRALYDARTSQRIGAVISSKDAALAFLQTEARSAVGGGVGPTHIGGRGDLKSLRHWRAVASQYAVAFVNGGEVFPYFTDRA